MRGESSHARDESEVSELLTRAAQCPTHNRTPKAFVPPLRRTFLCAGPITSILANYHTDR